MVRGHVPQRSCLACRKVRPKRELLRIVRTPSGEIKADLTGKTPGRGAYLCPSPECFRLASRQGKFARALGKEVAEEVLSQMAVLATQGNP